MTLGYLNRTIHKTQKRSRNTIAHPTVQVEFFVSPMVDRAKIVTVAPEHALVTKAWTNCAIIFSRSSTAKMNKATYKLATGSKIAILITEPRMDFVVSAASCPAMSPTIAETEAHGKMSTRINGHHPAMKGEMNASIVAGMML